MKKKPFILFSLKAIVMLILFSLPLSVLNNSSTKFYKKLCTSFFTSFRGNGYAAFFVKKNSPVMSIQVGNTSQRQSNGVLNVATSDVNVRYRFYLPVILFISLMIATPSSLRKKSIALIAGSILLIAFILLKQWIHLTYMCYKQPWLGLVDFSEKGAAQSDYLFNNFANFNGSSLVFAVVIWLVFTLDRKIFVSQNNLAN